MSLANFGAGAAAGVIGFSKGLRDAKADNMQDERDEVERLKLDSTAELIPVQTDLVKRKAASEVANLADAEELRPEQKAANLSALKLKATQDAHNLILTVMKAPEQQAAVTDSLMERMATQAAAGDKTSFLATLNIAAKSPLMAPLNGLGDAVDYAIVPATEGMIDAMGRPIPKSAVQLKMADGSLKYLNADTMTAAAARVQAAKNKAGSITLKPGEVRYNADGSIFAEGNDKAYGGLVQDPVTGEWTDMRPRTAGTGAGAGGKGKVPPTTQGAAQAMLDDLFEKNGKDLPPEARAKASSYLPAVLQNNPGLDPAVATRVAFEASTSPTRNLQIDPRTGSVALTYQNPEVDGGKPFILAPGAGTSAEMEKQLGGKKPMAAAIEGMLANQPGKGTGDAIKRAAADPAFQAKLEAAIGDPANIKALRQKIDLVKQYGLAAGSAKPVAAPAAGTPSSGPSLKERLARIGGMASPSSDAPAPPPEPRAAVLPPIERAKQERERQAKLRSDAEAQRTTAAETARRDFASDSKTMTPEALVRKYDALRGNLSTSDLQVLRAAEQKI